MLFFENDCFPFQKDFWERLDKLLDNDKFIDNVGMFGANCYQWIGYDEASKLVNSDDWFKKRSTGTATARGNLVNGIMNLHHPGWYCGFPKIIIRVIILLLKFRIGHVQDLIENYLEKI